MSSTPSANCRAPLKVRDRPRHARRRYLNWPVADPDGAAVAVVRDIRDAIDARNTELLPSLPA
ncbi:hypothetical protein [Streptomyces rishiriensis]|uniref:Protein-tyrosine-phosphatase n=1 Tax=Streptomyces rishiriensis TaxID=68264 RepID=A0ABU0NH65_STRRH|nr:hypothetical protein [Streptomyces rishiriensis]MDQ0578434.1 protein-tyrosine-phosphatase [Streptomyces rishiriensis]